MKDADGAAADATLGRAANYLYEVADAGYEEEEPAAGYFLREKPPLEK